MSELQAILAIAVMSFVTIALRFAPFAVLGNRKTPKLVTYLGGVLPYAVMGMLVVYCLKNMSFSAVENFFPHILAGIFVVLTYIWKRNTLLSIIGGTVCYMVLVQMVL